MTFLFNESSKGLFRSGRNRKTARRKTRLDQKGNHSACSDYMFSFFSTWVVLFSFVSVGLDRVLCSPPMGFNPTRDYCCLPSSLLKALLSSLTRVESSGLHMLQKLPRLKTPYFQSSGFHPDRLGTKHGLHPTSFSPHKTSGLHPADLDHFLNINCSSLTSLLTCTARSLDRNPTIRGRERRRQRRDATASRTLRKNGQVYLVVGLVDPLNQTKRTI